MSGAVSDVVSKARRNGQSLSEYFREHYSKDDCVYVRRAIRAEMGFSRSDDYHRFFK